MIEIHGLRCKRGPANDDPDGAHIAAVDATPFVRVAFEYSQHAALMTPDEAEWFAQQLCEAAARVRKLCVERETL